LWRKNQRDYKGNQNPAILGITVGCVATIKVITIYSMYLHILYNHPYLPAAKKSLILLK